MGLFMQKLFSFWGPLRKIGGLACPYLIFETEKTKKNP
jgi:hypothetical protein